MLQLVLHFLSPHIRIVEKKAIGRDCYSRFQTTLSGTLDNLSGFFDTQQNEPAWNITRRSQKAKIMSHYD